jgi:hypothetical protein
MRALAETPQAAREKRVEGEHRIAQRIRVSTLRGCGCADAGAILGKVECTERELAVGVCGVGVEHPGTGAGAGPHLGAS